MNTVKLTKDGFDALQKEHNELTSSKRQLAIDRLQKARAMGDLSENSEYTAAKEDLAFIEGRIQELETLIKNAEIVKQNGHSNKVDIGCVVTVDSSGKIDKFTIVGEFEADPMEKKLSSTSPIGSALLGKQKGEIVNIDVPAGKLTYKILEVHSM